MASSAPPRDEFAGDRVRRELDAALEDLYHLSAAETPQREFFDALLTRLRALTDAEAAAVWLAVPGESFELMYRQGEVWNVPRVATRESRRLAAAATGDPGWSACGSALRSCREAAHCPVIVDGRTWGVLTLYFCDAPAPAAKAGLLQIVEALASLAERRLLQAPTAERRHAATGAVDRLAELCYALQSTWRVSETADAIAFEGQRLLACDRLTVALRKPGGWRLASVGGIAAPDRRSPAVKRLQRLIAAAVKLKTPVVYEQDAAELPPQVQQPLEEYLDEAAARRLAIIPLFRNRAPGRPAAGRAFAALVVEQSTGRSLGELMPRALLTARLGEAALDRATSLRNIPLLGPLLGYAPVRRAVNRRRLPAWIAAVALAAAAVASLFVIETDFTVTLRGTAVPVEQRIVFAPAQGTIESLSVASGEEVTVGQELMQLKSPEIDLQIADRLGQADTLRNRLRAVRSERLQLEADETVRQSELIAEEQAIQLQLSHLRQQYELLVAERDDLVVTSPTAGVVVDWDVTQKLSSRPVDRGQALLTVADLSGAWRLEFAAPDKLAGHVLAAHGDAAVPLTIEYVTAGNPEATHQGTLAKIHARSQWNERERQTCVTMEAEFDRHDLPALRQGMSVVGKVHCGRRSLAYVWFHEAYEELQRRFF